jgi:hypothetical protein
MLTPMPRAWPVSAGTAAHHGKAYEWMKLHPIASTIFIRGAQLNLESEAD